VNVGVTSPPDGFLRYQIALESFGLRATRTPSLRIEPGDEPSLARLRAATLSSDLIFLTSARSVHFLWPEGSMPRVPVAAVGASTARAVTDAGGSVSHVGRAGAAALLSEIEPLLASSRVVYPRAAGAHPTTLTRLNERARSLRSDVAYTALPTAPPLDPVDGVAFASPSAVEGWFLARDTSQMLVAAIGLTTAAALRHRGAPPDAIAEIPSPAALAAAIAQLTEKRTLL